MKRKAYPRKRWWKKTLNVDWFDRLSSNGGEQITDTTADGKQVFWIIGDSNADGRGATIPTVESGTLYNWDKTNDTPITITTESVANDDNTKGSIWQQMATDWKAASGYSSVIVQCGRGGSEVAAAGDNIDWSETGTLYAPALEDVQNALTHYGLTRPKAIIINLGINDITAAKSTATIEAAIDSLLSRLTTEYPDTPILIIQVGRHGSASIDASLYHIREYYVSKAQAMENVHIVGQATSLIGAGQYNGDNLHYSQAGNNSLGSMLARWLNNSSYDKWSRAVISSHFDDLSANRKALVDQVVSGLVDRGDYFDVEQLSVFKTTTENNIYNDWAFLGYTFKVGSTFSENSHIATSGSPNVHTYSYIPSVANSRASQDDFIEGVKLKTRTTPDGTTAVLFGGCNASSAHSHYVRQTTTNSSFTSNDATGTNGPETNLAAGNFYATARNAGTKYLIKNSSVSQSASLASSGQSTQLPRIGGFNNNGTTGTYLAGEYEYLLVAKYTTFDLASFITDIEYLIAHWND
jgi:lysophospholipase L1-like esterase